MGTIPATGGTWGAGIGGSKWSVCGSITIKDTITRVTATKGKRAPNIIGAGNNSYSGKVTIGNNITVRISKDTCIYEP